MPVDMFKNLSKSFSSKRATQGNQPADGQRTAKSTGASGPGGEQAPNRVGAGRSTSPGSEGTHQGQTKSGQAGVSMRQASGQRQQGHGEGAHAPGGEDAGQASVEMGRGGAPLAVRLNRGPRLEEAAYVENPSVDLATIKILSKTGEFHANEEQAQYVCYLSDGRLLVAKGYETNSHVMSYEALLRRKNVDFRVFRTSIRTIQSLSGANGDRNPIIQTQTQDYATKLLHESTGESASDIHIRVDKRGTDILTRVNGDLVKIQEHDREYGMKLIRYYYQAMADVSEETFKENERLDARIGDRNKLPEVLNGIRIATTPTVDGSLMVMRLLYQDDHTSTDPCDLGFSERHREYFNLMQSKPIGIQIISGPTGSGKSTTLQKVLRDYIRKTNGSRNIITVEDPPEYPIPGAIQTPVGNADTQDKRAEQFLAAIASAMRLDPDVIMIGEVRDKPSAELSFRAATTGHQVWTTLHANSALAIISRLVNIGIDPDMLLDHNVLTGLIGQRLIKKLCPNCRIPLIKRIGKIPADALARYRRVLGENIDMAYVTGPGCEHCRAGTAGRTVAAEIIIPNARLCSLLGKGSLVDAYNYWQGEMGGSSIAQHTVEKVIQGIVDPIAAEHVIGPLTAAIETKIDLDAMAHG